MAITMVRCRAKVQVASLIVVTPYVQSFNVRKQRGQVSTFDASLKVPSDNISSLVSGDVKIWANAGTEETGFEATKLIFTGMCRSAKISPCHDDPFYVILSIGGADGLSLLQGKKFTRRCRGTLASWCSITGVVRKGLKDGKFAYNTEPIMEINYGDMERSNNTVGYSSKNVIDGMPSPTPAPTGINDIPVIIIAEPLSPVGGGNPEENAGGTI
jgi:hypothetical protein